MNILITSAGQRVSLVRAFQKELKLRFPGSKVYTVDMQPELSAACNVSDGYFKVKRVTDPQYIPELLALCQEKNIRMVVPTIDTELKVLSENRGLFDERNINCIVSAKEFVYACRDKRIIHEFFIEHGMDIPKEISRQNPEFPLFIKPYDGSLSVDTFLVRSAEELTAYHLDHPRLMFMEYIDRNEFDEYTVDMYYGRDYKVKCIVPRKRILVRAGEINKGLTCKNHIVPYLKDKLGKVEGAVGCLTTQVFASQKTDRIVAIEINPRFGGGFPLSYQAGANYPGWLMDEYFSGKKIEYTDAWEDQLLMLRYDDEVLVHQFKG